MSREGSQKLGEARNATGTSRSGLTQDTRNARSPEALSRAEKILVALLAALVGCAAAGFFAMNANYVAINGHLLGLQTQIGDLRTEMQTQIGGLRTDMQTQIGDLRAEMHKEIGDLRTDLSTRITRLEAVMETHHTGPARPAPRGDAARGPDAPHSFRR